MQWGRKEARDEGTVAKVCRPAQQVQQTQQLQYKATHRHFINPLTALTISRSAPPAPPPVNS